MHCDHTVHVIVDLWLDSQFSGHRDTKACPLTPSRLFPIPRGREVGMDVQTRRDISRTVEDRG